MYTQYTLYLSNNTIITKRIESTKRTLSIQHKTTVYSNASSTNATRQYTKVTELCVRIISYNVYVTSATKTCISMLPYLSTSITICARSPGKISHIPYTHIQFI